MLKKSKLFSCLFCFTFLMSSPQANADTNTEAAANACVDKEAGDLCEYTDQTGNAVNGTCITNANPSSNDSDNYLICTAYQID